MTTVCKSTTKASNWLSGVNITQPAKGNPPSCWHRSTEVHGEILKACDGGWSSPPSNADTAHRSSGSCPQAQIKDCSEGPGWDSELLKLGFNKDFLLSYLEWTKVCAIHLCTKANKLNKIFTLPEMSLSQKRHLLSFPKPSETQLFRFHPITSFHFILHVAVTQLTSSWHCSATLQRVRTKTVCWAPWGQGCIPAWK